MLKSICNDDDIMQQNQVTISSSCHESVKDVQKCLWYKFRIKTINTTNVITKFQPWAKVTPRLEIKINQA